MLQTVRYLIGTVGPSGFGSKTAAEDVTESCPDLRSLTAIITGKSLPTTGHPMSQNAPLECTDMFWTIS